MTFVLVDAVLNGAPFKLACAELGLPVVGVYTIERSTLVEMDPDHAKGDTRSLYGSDPAALAQQLLGTAEEICAVVPATEPAVHCATELAHRLGVPSNPLRTSRARRDKRAMRRLAAARGLRVPRYEVATDTDQVAGSLSRVGLPAIVKPATGAGSHNVLLVTTPGDVRHVGQAGPRDLFGGVIDGWLVEEYVRGREFAVNTFTVDGRHSVLDSWEYRLETEADYDNPYWDFVQVGPADPVRAQAERFALEVLAAFDVQIGPCHIEMKIDSRGPALIEIGARLPGAGIPQMWERHSDFRPYHDTLAVYLGRTPGVATEPPVFRRRLGMCFIRNEGPHGVLRRLDGLAEVERLPGVDSVVAPFGVGDQVPQTRNLGAELVKVRLAAPSDQALTELITRVRATIQVEVEALARAA